MPGRQPSDSKGSDPHGRPFRRANGHDDIARLKAEVHCGTVLERLSPPWRLDRRESTEGALKYRRGRGEIIIVNHDGHGWWDPCDPEAKGDVLNLVQRLAPGAGFKRSAPAPARARRHLPGLPGALRPSRAGPGSR